MGLLDNERPPHDPCPDPDSAAALSACSLLSAVWLVLHARDVALLLQPVFPLAPGKGRRLASFRQVSAVITLFGFSLAAQILIIARAAAA